MIRNSITRRLESLPVGHSDRLMSLRLPLQENQFATIISVYAPTLQADPTTKESFYSELRSLLQKTNETDKIFILGDFNARVGRGARAPWNWQLQRQRSAASRVVRRTLPSHHQLDVSAESQVQNYMEASALQTLAPTGLYPSAPEGYERRAPHKSIAKC